MAKNNQEKTPLVINFGGEEARSVAFDPTKKQAFVLEGYPGQLLVVAWDIDQSGFGGWRIKGVGVKKNGEMVQKEFEKGKPSTAFYGDISVVGAAQTDLYTSFGYEDMDMTDDDGNIVNKALEVRIRPVQE